MVADEKIYPKNSYIISQAAHITCKKDNHNILTNTVSESLSARYEKFQSSALVFIKSLSTESKINAIHLLKHANNIMLEKDV
jgi:hypothetical protein